MNFRCFVRRTSGLSFAASLAWMTPAARAQKPGDPAGKIMTVLGPVDPMRGGHTLMHEHVLADFNLPDEETARWPLAGRVVPIRATAVQMYNVPLTMEILSDVQLGAYNRDNWQLTNESTALNEMSEFKQHGGATIVDVSSIGLKRDPGGLQRIARASGVNIVMGAGWYSRAWWPNGLERRSIQSLADEIVRDVTQGVDGTTVRAGIIGEIQISDSAMSPGESNIIHAAGRASRVTGAAVTLDSRGAGRVHGKILDILASEGTDLKRVILGHCDYLVGDPGYIQGLLKRGVTVEFDMLGSPPLVTRTRPLDSEVAQAIVDLAKLGYVEQIVLSQDVSEKTRLKAYGGTGYSFIDESFLPYLKRHDMSDVQLSTIVVDNPRRLLTLVAPRPTRATGDN